LIIKFLNPDKSSEKVQKLNLISNDIYYTEKTIKINL